MNKLSLNSAAPRFNARVFTPSDRMPGPKRSRQNLFGRAASIPLAFVLPTSVTIQPEQMRSNGCKRPVSIRARGSSPDGALDVPPRVGD